MQIKELMEILHIANKLKTVTRHNFMENNRQESVAEHSYRLALFAFLMGEFEEFSNIDIDKVIKMCLIHDLGEAFTGDIPTFLKKDDDAKKEDEIFYDWVDSFSSPTKEKWRSLLDEMIALETNEAKLYKALDKMEAMLAHNETDVDTWLELEHTLQLNYAKKAVAHSTTLSEINEYLNDWSRSKTKAMNDTSLEDPHDPI